MVKQPINEQTEFTMSNEDFPALPGTQSAEGLPNNALSNSIDENEKLSNIGAGISMGMDLQTDSVLNEQALKRGVQTSSDGKKNTFKLHKNSYQLLISKCFYNNCYLIF